MKTARRIALLITGLLALAPAAASADTFCVHSPANCNGTPQPDLQAALDAADGNGAGTMDTIKLGVGLFGDPVATDVAGNPVTIEGTASNQTALTTGMSTIAPAVLRVLEPSSAIHDLRVHNVSPNIPVGLELAGKAKDVLVTNGSSALNGDGVHFAGTKAEFTDSGVEMVFLSNNQPRGIFAGPGTAGAVTHSYVSAAIGVAAEGGNADVRWTRFDAVGGMSASGGSQSTIADSQIVESQLATNYQRFGVFAGGAGSTKLTASRLTVIGKGSGYGVWVSPNGGNPGDNDATVQLGGSILDGWTTDLRENAPAGQAGLIDVSWTAFDFASQGGKVNLGAGNDDLGGQAPGFVDPTAEVLQLNHDSPLVDRGDPNYHPFLAFDVNFHARVIDGDGDGTARVDLGAAEYGHQKPVADAQAKPGTVDVGQAVSYDGNGSHDPDPGDTLTYDWSFDDGTTATGATAQHAWSTAGDHVAALTVTDPTGQTDAKQVHVTVTEPTPPAQPSTGSDPQPSSGSDPQPSGGSDPGQGFTDAPGGGDTPQQVTPMDPRHLKPSCKKPKRHRKHSRSHARSAKKRKAKPTCRKPRRKHHRHHPAR